MHVGWLVLVAAPILLAARAAGWFWETLFVLFFFFEVFSGIHLLLTHVFAISLLIAWHTQAGVGARETSLPITMSNSAPFPRPSVCPIAFALAPSCSRRRCAAQWDVVKGALVTVNFCMVRTESV